MRIALLSDIHGNSVALDAVLADLADHEKVDAYWCLGDLVALGAGPIPGLPPSLSDIELVQRLQGCGAMMVCVGHTHHSIDRDVDGIRLINPGAVSFSNDVDTMAPYAVLESGGRPRVSHRSVSYDREAVVAQLEALHHRARAFLIRHLRDTSR
jgi:predicted phosphodiesterase